MSMSATDTVVVVLCPGAGDGIQAMKSGLARSRRRARGQQGGPSRGGPPRGRPLDEAVHIARRSGKDVWSGRRWSRAARGPPVRASNDVLEADRGAIASYLRSGDRLAQDSSAETRRRTSQARSSPKNSKRSIWGTPRLLPGRSRPLLVPRAKPPYDVADAGAGFELLDQARKRQSRAPEGAGRQYEYASHAPVDRGPVSNGSAAAPSDARSRWDAEPLRGVQASATSSFTTLSGRGARARSTVQTDVAPRLRVATWGGRGSSPSRAACTPRMYRGRLWTMRQFAGLRYGARDERALQVPARSRSDRALRRLRLPDPDGARLGRSDAQPGRGRSGRGRDLEPLRDMETLMDGIPMDRGFDLDDDQRPGADPAGLLHRLREKQGVDPAKRAAWTVQNDILKEYQAQHAWLVPPSRPCG